MNFMVFICYCFILPFWHRSEPMVSSSMLEQQSFILVNREKHNKFRLNENNGMHGFRFVRCEGPVRKRSIGTGLYSLSVRDRKSRNNQRHRPYLRLLWYRFN